MKVDDKESRIGDYFKNFYFESVGFDFSLFHISMLLALIATGLS